jgi:hypothetical protein
MITQTRVKRINDKLDELRLLLDSLESKVKNKLSLRHIDHAKTNLKLARYGVERAHEEGNK